MSKNLQKWPLLRDMHANIGRRARAVPALCDYPPWPSLHSRSFPAGRDWGCATSTAAEAPCPPVPGPLPLFQLPAMPLLSILLLLRSQGGRGVLGPIQPHHSVDRPPRQLAGRRRVRRPVDLRPLAAAVLHCGDLHHAFQAPPSPAQDQP